MGGRQKNQENVEGKDKEKSGFKEAAQHLFGGEVDVIDLKTKQIIDKVKIFEGAHLENRDYLQKERENKEEGKPEESDKEEGTMSKMARQSSDSFNILGFSFPFTANNVFFFQQTNGSSKKVE